MDKREIAIHFGQKRQNELGLQNTLLVADFMDAYPSHKYTAVVSLQGLTEAFHCQQKRIFESVATYLMKDGYLIMIDELPGQSVHYEKMWKQSGFHLCAAGMVGGLGIDHEWKSYLALVLKLGGSDTTKTLVEAEKQPNSYGSRSTCTELTPPSTGHCAIARIGGRHTRTPSSFYNIVLNPRPHMSTVHTAGH